MKIVLLVLVFIYVVAFFWLIWKSAPTWRWYHIVLVIFAFLLTLPLLPMTAIVLKSRQAWTKQAEDLTARLALGQREREGWIRGVPGNPAKDPGMLELQSELRDLKAEVGRVFRDLQVQQRDQNGIVLAQTAPAAAGIEGVPPEPAAPAEGAPAAGDPLAAEGTIVYGFAERPLQEGGPALPVYYLGEFRVTGATENAVTVVPNAPLEEDQLQAVNQASQWALYELLPTDSHEVFIVPGSTPDDDHIFGRVDEEAVRALMGDSVLPETLAAYLRDGSRALPNDPPAALWVKIEFTKPTTISVDGAEQRSAADGGFFDALGQAVDSRLQRADGDSVTFEPGEQLIVKKEAADSLIEEGSARLIDQYFVRPLNSYRLVLRSLRQQIDYLDGLTRNLQRQHAVLQRALDLTNEMTTEGQQRKLQLEKDEAQVERELAAIAAYVEQLEQKFVSTKSELARLYRENLTLERELDALQDEAAQEVRAREAQIQ